MYTEQMLEVVNDLKRAESVPHWNAIRASNKRKISAREMARIDSSGLITQVLGFDDSYEEFWQRIEKEREEFEA